MSVHRRDSLPHRDSHRDLLVVGPVFGRVRGVDAVVVAAGVAGRTVSAAATLAQELGCTLVVMRSGAASDAATLRSQAVRRDVRQVAIIEITENTAHPLLEFRTSEETRALDGRLGALSIKRNLGLILGRMLGWRTVVLLDDDIHAIDAAEVRRAARRLSTLVAVGMTVHDYPDHSVVCHANLLAGRNQKVFVGGSALVLDPARCTGFFPRIYNEDWLFLAPALREKAVGRVGQVRQQPYDPFIDPGRARVEEFGEVIAEGIIDGVRRGRHRREFHDQGIWTHFLDSRASFIHRAAELLARQPDATSRAPALESLAEAARALSTIDAEQCVAYYRAWREDLRTWSTRLAEIRPTAVLGSAVNHLGLTATVDDLVP